MFNPFRSMPTRTHRARVSAADVNRPVRTTLTEALASQDHLAAKRCLEHLEQAEPLKARWPHKRGDVLLLMQRKQEAFSAYARAVYLYSETHKPNLARAMANTAMTLCPDFDRVLPQLDAAVQTAFRNSVCMPQAFDSHDLERRAPASHRDVVGCQAAS